jgi:glutathione S-transferase
MDTQIHTLWLWTEGAFARRVMYQLLIKGLVASPEALLRGETTEKSLRINPAILEAGVGWVYGDPTDLPPPGSTNPCLRTADAKTGVSKYVYESTSIILYLETLFPAVPMQPDTAIEWAHMMDLLGKINLVAMDTNYFLRNTIPEHGAVMGVTEPSRAAALNARANETSGLVKFQQWALDNGLQENDGWLTPCVNRPGLVDVTLASNHRFVELMYNIDMLAGEALRPLSAWYARLKLQPWWDGLENRDGLVPTVLANGKTSRVAWVKEWDEQL